MIGIPLKIEDFLVARRELLAAAMNDVLNG